MPRTEVKAFYETTRDAKKIAVADLGFLGDTVHLIPALWEIKRHYPAAKLHVISAPVGAEVLRMVPCVDRAWAVTLDPAKRRLGEQLTLARALRRERFDATFNFNGADRSVILTALIRARRNVAYQGARKHFWQPWLVRDWIPRAKLPTPVHEARRQILAWCGFTLQPARFDLAVPAAEKTWALEHIPAGAVHLSLSASFALKEWPLANNVALARRLVNENFQVVVSVAPNPREQARVEQLRRDINDARLLVINETLSIPRLAALLERCALHVGPDSGVLHLAAALNVGTVGIFRRYHDMADWLPTGPRHVYFDAECACLGKKNPPCAAANEAACLGRISAETVAAEIRRRLTPMEAAN